MGVYCMCERVCASVQTDSLPAWGCLHSLPSSKGKGCLDAPESKCPRAAPDLCSCERGAVGGRTLSPAALPLERDPSIPRHFLSVGYGSSLPHCPLRAVPYSPHALLYPLAERPQRDLERLNCLPLELPHLLFPAKKPIRSVRTSQVILTQPWEPHFTDD